MPKTGILYLLPSSMGEGMPREILSQQEVDLLLRIKHFVAENEKTARRFIKFLVPEVIQSELSFSILDKRTTPTELKEIVEPLLQGNEVGLISEAGLPCIADPGNILVGWAHRNGIRVKPINGPSSIVLALVASGMNGQKFSFNGYLPIDKSEKKKALQKLETISKSQKSAQIFIETPYRNNAMFEDIVKTLSSETQLCVATNITLEDEFIRTLPIKLWKKENLDIHKKPTIFIIEA